MDRLQRKSAAKNSIIFFMQIADGVQALESASSPNWLYTRYKDVR